MASTTPSSVHERLIQMDTVARQLARSREDLIALQTLEKRLHTQVEHARMSVSLVEGFVCYLATRGTESEPNRPPSSPASESSS